MDRIAAAGLQDGGVELAVAEVDVIPPDEAAKSTDNLTADFMNRVRGPWAATLVTTVNVGEDPVSGWGRVVAVLMRIYAVGVFGYLTASIASYFVAQVSPDRLSTPAAIPSPPRGPQSGAQ